MLNPAESTTPHSYTSAASSSATTASVLATRRSTKKSRSWRLARCSILLIFSFFSVVFFVFRNISLMGYVDLNSSNLDTKMGWWPSTFPTNATVATMFDMDGPSRLMDSSLGNFWYGLHTGAISQYVTNTFLESSSGNTDEDGDGKIPAVTATTKVFQSTNTSSSSPRETIAYAISITGCDNVVRKNLFDNAAVLHRSIKRAHTKESSNYDAHTIAFVHPIAAINCSKTLSALGYEVQVRESPLELTDIQNEALVKAQSNACCGINEYLKLYSWTLDYPLVVHLDADCLVLKPMDSLFSTMLSRPPRDGNNRASTIQRLPIPEFTTNDTQWIGKTVPELPSNIGFAFTRDYNMVDPPKKQPHQIGVQGGFLVVKPNRTEFDRLVDVIRTGGGGFANRVGWGGKTKGYGGYYGAGTIQGLASYYYGEFASDRALELNRCHYNNMVDDSMNTKVFLTKRSKKLQCRTTEETCQDCRATDVSQIFTTHFILCGKVHWCNPHNVPNPRVNSTSGAAKKPKLCNQLLQQWHKLRYEIEEQWMLDYPGYDPHWVNSDNDKMKIFHKHCHGPNAYVRMRFPEDLHSASVIG